MGLSIHYNGRFNKKPPLSEMIEEVRDIAEIHNWEYHIFGTKLPDMSIDQESNKEEVYGISFSPPHCEPIWLCFLSNGRMSSPVNLQCFGNSVDDQEKKYLYLLSTKTQYAGINIHKLIIHLLKYLSTKYFIEFNLSDEGRYWETGDVKLLEQIFDRYNRAMDILGSALDNIPYSKAESIEEYFARILEMIRKN
ncbi:MAG TPA: hypothetical protein VI583_02540 [Cyclobacteriaceae bacterium]|nr:hypothetical protein [Cyclobacteriaceae bacterium]